MIRVGSRTPQALMVGTVPAVRAFLGRVLVWPETAARTAIRFFEGIYRTELEFTDESGERWFDGRLASTYQSGHRICGKQDAMGFLYAADDSRSLSLDSQPAEIPITQVATKAAFDAAEQNLSAGAGVLLTGEPAAVLDPDGNQVGTAYPLAVRLTAESDTWNGARRWWIVLGNFTNGVVGRGSDTVRYRWTWNDTTQSVAEPGFFIGYVGGDGVYRGEFLYGYQAWPEETYEQTFVITLAEAGTVSLAFRTQPDHWASVSWGDGTSEDLTGTTISSRVDEYSGSHSYQAGTFTLVLRVPVSVPWVTLRSFTLPASGAVRELHLTRTANLGMVFRAAAGLISADLADGNVADMGMQGCPDLTSASFGPDFYGGFRCFKDCTALGPNLEMSGSSYGLWAFQNCTALRKVWIRESVTNLGEGAFEDTSESLVVYVEADSQPATWTPNWDGAHLSGSSYDRYVTTVWGQKTRPW